MRFPVDTSRLRFMVVAAAEELRQFEEGRPREAWARRTDAIGEVLCRVQVVALGDEDAEIIRVTVPGDPKVAQGEMVRLQDMTIQGWEMEGRSGTTFRASAVRSEGRGQDAAKSSPGVVGREHHEDDGGWRARQVDRHVRGRADPRGPQKHDWSLG
jgi:hypothetical protein